MFDNITEMTKNSTDRELIKLLEDDAGQSSYELSKKLTVSPSTVRRRKRKLIQSGVIRESLSINYQKLGIGFTAHIALNVDHNQLDSVWKELSQLPQIKRKSIITGRYDMLVMVRLESADALLNFVQAIVAKIKGIKSCETFICLRQEEQLL